MSDDWWEDRGTPRPAETKDGDERVAVAERFVPMPAEHEMFVGVGRKRPSRRIVAAAVGLITGAGQHSPRRRLRS